MRRRASRGGLALVGAVLGSALVLGASAPARVEVGIPSKVRAALLKETRFYVKRYHFAWGIRAVGTTLARAGHAKEEPKLQGRTPVYVVAFRFATKCTAPKGETCGRQKHVLELEYLASNLETLREELRFSYPHLKTLGVPILLAAKAT